MIIVAGQPSLKFRKNTNTHGHDDDVYKTNDGMMSATRKGGMGNSPHSDGSEVVGVVVEEVLKTFRILEPKYMKQLENENSIAREVYQHFVGINQEEIIFACDIILGFPAGSNASVDDILGTRFHYEACVKYCSSQCGRDDDLTEYTFYQRHLHKVVSRTWELLSKSRQPDRIESDLKAKRRTLSFTMPQCCGSVLVGLSSKRAKMKYPKILTSSSFKDFVSDLDSLADYLDSETVNHCPKLDSVNAFVSVRRGGNGDGTFGAKKFSDHQVDGKKSDSVRMNEIEKELASIVPQGMRPVISFGHLLQSLTSADLDQNLDLIMNRGDTTKFLNSVLVNGMFFLELMRYVYVSYIGVIHY